MSQLPLEGWPEVRGPSRVRSEALAVHYRSDVCIVGGGPVGLVLAARLASFGVQALVLDANASLREEGSKACLIQGDVLEILDKFGCAAPIAQAGVTWTVGNTYVRDVCIRRHTYPRPLGFGPFVNISQRQIEEVLLEHVRVSGRTRVLFGHNVEQVISTAEGARVRGSSPKGAFEVACEYVVGCDGINSTVRSLLGTAWDGYTHPDLFLITDIRADLPLAQERHFHFDPSFNAGRQVIIHPQPDNVWRVDIQLPPHTVFEARRFVPGGPVPPEIDRRVRAVVGDTPYEMKWWSTYRFQQRVAARFSKGRVFLAGDAAHALPPYGARGMNSGIQDADNLAWKLAFVRQGAARRLLDSYDLERRAAAEENLAVTEQTIQYMVPPSPMRRALRATTLGLAERIPRAHRFVNSGRMAEPFVYTKSPIVSRAKSPAIGAFAPDGRVTVGESSGRIRQLLGRDLTVLAFVRQLGDLSPVRPYLRSLAERSVSVVALPPPGADCSNAPDLTVACDIDATRTRFGTARLLWVLVRPDGHVAHIENGVVRPTRLVDALMRCAGVTWIPEEEAP